MLDRSTQGWPGKYSLCFAEDEESSPWEPLSVARGFKPGQSTVTVFAAESGHNILAHGRASPEQLLALFADAMAGLDSLSPGRSVIVLAPEHAGHLKRAQRWTWTASRESGPPPRADVWPRPHRNAAGVRRVKRPGFHPFHSGNTNTRSRRLRRSTATERNRFIAPW